MRFKTFTLLFVILGCASISQADILSATCSADGDGVITCTSSMSEKDIYGEYGLSIDGIHDVWDYGHIIGEITTDSELDPTIKVINSIDNDTDFTWTDYHLNIYMDQLFSIVTGSAKVYDPSDWDPNSVITAVSGGGHYDSHGNYHQYMGSIDYYAGTAVPVTGTLEFGYKISFNYSGTVNYCQEMLPTPEPGTFVLFACGLLGLLIVGRRFV